MTKVASKKNMISISGISMRARRFARGEGISTKIVTPFLKTPGGAATIPVASLNLRCRGGPPTDRIFNHLFYERIDEPSHSAGPGEMSIPFLLDKKPTVVLVGSAGEQSGGARKVLYGAAPSKSERAAPSACVSRRFSAPQIIWNRSPLLILL